MSQPIILKGVVGSRFLDPNNEVLISVQSAPGGYPFVADQPSEYKFDPSFNVTLRASDLGDPPVGATVKVTVELS